ncbi:MAG: hypothetical protein WA667_06940 [Candidatus Nitrosopolaris sp.]
MKSVSMLLEAKILYFVKNRENVQRDHIVGEAKILSIVKNRENMQKYTESDRRADTNTKDRE